MIIIDKVDGKLTRQLTEISSTALLDEKVLVDVAYSTVNYKDGLAISPHSPAHILQKFPMVGGIDLTGTIRASPDPHFPPGDRVLVNGYGLSEHYWGGFAQQARLKPELLARVPDALTLKHATAIGTAGYSAMLCILAIEDHGVKPGDRPIPVTGAAGGIGSIAIMLLAAMGHEVVAVSGRVDASGDYLKMLGASRLLGRGELPCESAAVETETWAAVIACLADPSVHIDKCSRLPPLRYKPEVGSSIARTPEPAWIVDGAT